MGVLNIHVHVCCVSCAFQMPDTDDLPFDGKGLQCKPFGAPLTALQLCALQLALHSES